MHFCWLIILSNHQLLLLIDEHRVNTHKNYIKKSMYVQTKKSNSTRLTKTNPIRSKKKH
jgi:hypothetical protein